MDLTKELKELLANVIGSSDFDENTKLIASGLIDSFGVMQFIGDVEEKYGIEFDLDEFEFEQFNTLPSIVEAVEKLIGEKK